jgi:hypothetical protein
VVPSYAFCHAGFSEQRGHRVFPLFRGSSHPSGLDRCDPV